MHTPLQPRLFPGDPTFDANRVEMLRMLQDLERPRGEALEGGGARYVERHRARGRLLARQRLELLSDEYAPLLELSPLAGAGTADPVGGSVVTALAFVEGTQCVVIANDPTRRGGSVNPTTVRKMLRAMEIAQVNHLPLVLLVESGGADLPRQAEIFVTGGVQFRMLTQMSAAGIPVVTVVFGSSTAGGAYLPGLSDYTIFVQSQARVFLGGPPLVKMAIDEDVDEETLGGAQMHATVSGLCDYLAADEHDALAIARGVVAHLRHPRLGPRPRRPVVAPNYPGEELLGVASPDVRVPFDIREALARIADGSEFEEFKQRYGTSILTGWGSIGGYPVGIVANNGILFSAESQKAAQFIQLCNRIDTPILFVQNITGFMVGTEAERGGIIKDGAKLINAVSNSGVPHITLMVGASYGAGNYGMAGRAYDPRFVFTWPNHRIAVMGPKQLAGVMELVTKGRDPEMVGALEAQVEAESTALHATGQLWDDGIIDPRDTRNVLTVALAATHSGPVSGSSTYGTVRH